MRLLRPVFGLLAAAVLLAGCSLSTPGVVADAPPPVRVTFASIFEGQFTAPARLSDLQGLALYNTAIEPLGPDGDGREGQPRFVVYALINNRNPLQGILVGSHTPLSLGFFRERHNASTIVSGSVYTFSAAGLVRYYHEHHGIQLATNADGQPYWIEGVETPTAVPAAASKATPSPPNRATQPSSQPDTEDNDENTPFDRELVFNPPGQR